MKNIDEVTSYTGLKTNDGIESITVSVPVMTAQAYSVAIVKVKDSADVEKIKQEMLDNIDMRRWICVSAEQLYITNSGNVIFSVMADKDIAKAVYNDFKKYVNNNIGKELEKRRDDIEFLGQDRGFYYFDNCKMELFHPGGGTSRILSTKPQNGIDQIPSHTKPKISLRGHYHKSYYMFYRNVHTFLCPCKC